MNFLSKAKETANKLNDSAQAQKPSVPGVKPNIPGKPTLPGKGAGVPKPPTGVPGVKPPVGGPGKPPVAGVPKQPVTAPGKPPIATKPNVTAPATPTATAEKESDIKIENDGVTTAPLKNNNPFKKTPVQAPAATAEPKVEEKKEDKVTEVTDIKEDFSTEANVGPTEEVKVEEPKAATTGKKTNSRKKPAAKADTDVVSDKPEIITETALIIPKTQIEFEEAINSIKSGFIDEAWESFRAENAQKLNEIVISSDMTTAMIKSTLSELSLMKDSIWLIFNDTKTMYENLTAKEPEGLIERIKKISSKGSNPEERKLNATYAVMNYKDENGNIVNLYELLDEIRDRYNFTKSLMDGINYKNSVLITMLGSLKLEK